MADHQPNTKIQNLETEFLHTLDALSQFLEQQSRLGNTFPSLSEDSLDTIEKWGTKAWYSHGFSAQGPKNAQVMIVDSNGNFYDGSGGNLLVKILKAMHLTPSQVYICNTVDVNRIQSHIVNYNPHAIITLGKKAGNLLLQNNLSLTDFRGQFFEIKNVPVMPTFHPSDLIENPSLKRQVWDDMQKVMARIGL